MVSVNIQPAGSRPPAIAKQLPSKLDFPGRSLEAVTVGEVKQAIAKQCPKVFSNNITRLHLLSIMPVSSHQAAFNGYAPRGAH